MSLVSYDGMFLPIVFIAIKIYILNFQQLHNRCASSVSADCTLGQFVRLIIPPTSIFPAVLDRQRSVNVSTMKNKSTSSSSSSSAAPGMHFQINDVPSTSPLLVFINPKSGGRQGDRILRKFQYMLNPRQIFDLSKGGPIEGLNMYKDLTNFQVLCCGGDGTVGWVLEAMGKTLLVFDISFQIYILFIIFPFLDSIDMAHQPSVGVIPLGTGNDLARCLRWGGGYEGESIPKLLDKINNATTVMLDRWSIEVINHSPPEQQIPKPKVLQVITSLFNYSRILTALSIRLTKYNCTV